ncbi:hypothetical protein SDC9_148427 [bioreactor metagenome]|uniref:Uncharacterized protein n=1 Tax=bioreactor metagenome TaxID=1076179 RepID=A0A645EH20_9ZZZZ
MIDGFRNPLKTHDVDVSLRPFDGQPFAGVLVQPFPVHLDRGIHRRNLDAFANHGFHRCIDGSQRQRLIDRFLRDRLPLAVLSRCGNTDSDFPFVCFVRVRQKLDDFCGFPDADRQNAINFRIQSAGMPDFFSF